MLEATKDTEYRIEGRTRGTNVLIYVDIRHAHPTVAELRIVGKSSPQFPFVDQGALLIVATHWGHFG